MPGTPPEFLQLAGHPLRWRLLRELATSDLRVGELCERAEQPQSLVSYHLRRLRDGGLLERRRSAADGRDSYYVLDLARCKALLADTGAALHPALAGDGRSPVARASVLFLCTGNSARSQMAEALAVAQSGGRVAAASAGSSPKALHPQAVRVMARRGIDIAGRHPKHVDALAGRRFDRVVTLCDRVRALWPGLASAHWSVRDPAAEGTPAAFERTADELAGRIGFLLATLQPEPRR